MKIFISISFTILIGFITVSCSENKNEKPLALPDEKMQEAASTSKVMTEAVEINTQVLTTEDKRIVINGTTNLPDSTSLLITLDNEVLGFSTQDEVNVSNGRFSTSPLGKATGLPDGNYVIQIVMPMPLMQPKSVQTIIGQQGQHLTGSLVENVSEFGLVGRTVEKNISYSLGSSESIAQIERQQKNLIASIIQETKVLLTRGQEMESIRNTDELHKLRLCGEQMRANQSKAVKLSQQSEGLPLKYIKLKAAITDITFCVSCSTNALEACERAKESLQENEI